MNRSPCNTTTRLSNMVRPIKRRGPRTFRRFSRLPPELRLQIWKYYALPSTPLLHVFYGLDFIPEVTTYSAVDHSWYGSGIHIRQIRSIMQVSCEARAAVLNGREMVPCSVLVSKRRPTKGYCFMDYERDIFHIDDPIDAPETELFYFSHDFLSKVRHLVIGYALQRSKWQLHHASQNNLPLRCVRIPDLCTKSLERLEHLTLVLVRQIYEGGRHREILEFPMPYFDSTAFGAEAMLRCVAFNKRAFHPAELGDGVENCSCISYARHPKGPMHEDEDFFHVIRYWGSWETFFFRATVGYSREIRLVLCRATARG